MDEKLFYIYSGIVAFQYHPKNPVQERMSHASCLQEAIKAMLVYQHFVDGKDK